MSLEKINLMFFLHFDNWPCHAHHRNNVISYGKRIYIKKKNVRVCNALIGTFDIKTILVIVLFKKKKKQSLQVTSTPDVVIMRNNIVFYFHFVSLRYYENRLGMIQQNRKSRQWIKIVVKPITSSLFRPEFEKKKFLLLCSTDILVLSVYSCIWSLFKQTISII